MSGRAAPTVGQHSGQPVPPSERPSLGIGQGDRFGLIFENYKLLQMLNLACCSTRETFVLVYSVRYLFRTSLVSKTHSVHMD